MYRNNKPAYAKCWIRGCEATATMLLSLPERKPFERVWYCSKDGSLMLERERYKRARILQELKIKDGQLTILDRERTK